MADLTSASFLGREYIEDATRPSQDTVYTTANGAPVPHPYEAQRAGSNGGPLLLQDHHLIDLISHFDRERIPERVVHAKGGGAHGYYETTDSLEDLCLADIFKPGKKCPITIRFSTVGGESGSHDVARDPRGFSIKMRTAEGNWDIVANNTPGLCYSSMKPERSILTMMQCFSSATPPSFLISSTPRSETLRLI